MRVCFLTPVLDAYKGGNHLPLLGAVRGVEFVVLTNRTKPAEPELPENVTVETLGARIGPYEYGSADFLFARAVLHQYPPSHSFWQRFDVIHLNQTMGPPLLSLQKTGVPVFLLIHHPVSVDRAAALEESSFLEGLRWHMKYAMLVRWQRRFCCTLPHIVTVSHTAADRMAADYGCDRTNIHVVPNGVDGNVFVPGNLSAADFDVIAVGSFLHPRKGFRYLLRVYQMLAQKGYRIADVGRRSDKQQAALRAISQVRRFGMVDHDQLLSLLQRSSTLISTSLYEGFGLSLIEALSCGRPAFAFDGGAVQETLGPIDLSLVVPLRDTAALVRRIEDFLCLPPLERVRRGEKYREDVLRLYPLERSAQMLRELYENLS